jgi:hypothetical protein
MLTLYSRQTAVPEIFDIASCSKPDMSRNWSRTTLDRK